MKISFGETINDSYTNFGYDTKSFIEEVDNGCCTEIIVPILDYVPVYELNSFLSNLFSKMRHKCEIVLEGSDIYESMKMLLVGDAAPDELNVMLYGTKDLPKVGQYSLDIITKAVLGCGLKILEKDIQNNKMYLRAERE